MKFNLRINEGTDLIKFGMTSEEIQSILKIKPDLFKKTEFDIYDTEDYRFCHVFYEAESNKKLVCAAIEFFKPSQVFLDNMQLIGAKKETGEDLFKTKFEDCVTDTSNTSSKKYDIAFYAPRKTISSVFIARKGYNTEQEAFYNKAFHDKYEVSEENEDPAVRKRLCPNCMNIIDAKEGALCPECNVLMI